MRVAEWLESSAEVLSVNGVATARLDCLVMLEDITGKDRSWLLAHPEFEISRPQQKILSEQIKRRSTHEPLAYIRGKTEFYGREFIVSPDTLEPRPESETMIEMLKNLTLADKTCIVDVGTGSGALAITAKLELSKTFVFATDISKPALKIAKQNAQKHQVDVSFFQGNLLSPLPSALSPQPLVLICNLPYVPDGHTINQAAMQEPSIAIFGGPDGLDLYRQMFEQAVNLPQKPKWILTESLPPQHPLLMQIAKDKGYVQSAEDDFIQVWKSGNP